MDAAQGNARLMPLTMTNIDAGSSWQVQHLRIASGHAGDLTNFAGDEAFEATQYTLSAFKSAVAVGPTHKCGYCDQPEHLMKVLLCLLATACAYNSR